MKMKKILTIALCLMVGFAFAACGSDEATGQDQDYGQLYTEAKEGFAETIGNLDAGTVGETLSNPFFDWKVNSVVEETELEGKTAEEGYKFVVVNISVENTTEDTYAVGNYDFIGITEVSEDGQLDTMDSFYDKMYPDEQELAAGKTLTGDLVFEVKEDVSELIIDYQVFYEDETTGDTNWACLKL